MADLTFTISIRDDGTPVLKNIQRTAQQMGSGVEAAGKQAAGGLAGIETAGKRAAGGLTALAARALSLSGIFATLGVSLGVSQIVQAADTYALLAGRLRLVTDSAAELTQVQESLFDVAQRTSAAYESTVDLYTRLARSTQSLGLSQHDLLGITETVNQAIAVSGASAQAAQAALFQLGQGLGAGALRGEEFNSVLEQTPRLAQAIADGLGVTIGQLRELAADGKLTAETVTTALKSQSATIAGEFGQLPVTVGGALTRLGNSVLKFIGEADQATGTSTKLAQTIVKIAEAAEFTADKLDILGEKLTQLKAQARIAQLQALTREIAQLEQQAAKLPDRGLLEVFFGGREALEQKLAQLRAEQQRLQQSLTHTGDTAAKAGAQIAQFIGPQIPAEVQKFREQLDKQNQTLKQQADTYGLSARAALDYQAGLLKTQGAAEAQIATFRSSSLALIAKKEAEEASKKATQAHEKALREHTKAQEEETKVAQGVLAISNALRKEEDDRLAVLAKVIDETQKKTAADLEQARIIEQGIVAGRAYDDIQRDVAIHLAERALIEKGVTENVRGLAVASVEATAELKKQTEQLDALKNTGIDIGPIFKNIAQGLAQGTLDLKNVFRAAGATVLTEFATSFFIGKQTKFDLPLKANALGLVGPSGILGSIFGQGGASVAGSFSHGFLGRLFGGALPIPRQILSGLTDSLAALGIGDLSTALGGFNTALQGAGKIGAGFLGFGLAEGLKGLFGVGGSAEAALGGKLGGAAGGVAGTIIGTAFGNPELGAFLGALGGDLFGSLIGSLFAHTPTKGTQIRKGVKDFLTDIEVSFAGEIDSGEYFFEESKQLADKMFGGDFLAASKQVLTDKAGPELAAQLQALGTALTADQALKLGKSVEQTGTTFGNLLLANLGLDAIPDAIDEIVQKSGLTLESLTDKLTDVFAKGKISADFYQTAILGAVDIFSGDLPAAINVSKLALQSFTDDGIFSLSTFQEKVDQATAVFDLIGQAAVEAVRNSNSGAEAARLFGEQLQRGLEELAVNQLIAQFLDERLFAGLDLSDGLSADEIATLTDRVAELRVEVDALRTSFDGVAESTDGVIDRITALDHQIADLSRRRIALRFEGVEQLAQLGAVSPLQAITVRQEGTLAGLAAIGAQAPIADLPVAALEEGIALIGELRGIIVQRYAAERQAVEEQLRATEQAIRTRYARERAYIQETITALQDERQQVQELFRARLDGLRTELQVARDFQAAAAAVQTTISGIVSPQFGFSAGEQLGFLQRQAQGLRRQLADAPDAQRPDLIRQLTSLLQQQLQTEAFQIPSDAFVAQRTAILAELESLHAQALAEGSRAAQIEADILAAELAMQTALASIDQQISAQRAQLDALSAREQAEIAHAREAAVRQIEALRHEATEHLLTAIHFQELFSQSLQAKLEQQRSVLVEQLIALVGVEQATALLADRDTAVIVTLSHLTATLTALDGTLARLQASATPIQFAAQGFHGLVTQPTHFVVAERAPEFVSITPGLQPGGTVAGPAVSVAPHIPISVVIEHRGPTPVDGEQIGRGLGKALMYEWRHGELGREIRLEMDRRRGR